MPDVSTPVRTPTRTDPGIEPGPERYLSPDKLCPDQKKDAGDGGRPL